MKLLDILQEEIAEYKVSYIVIKDKNVSKGSASYKDLADATKFFDTLTKDPELYNARLEKIFSADSNYDMGGAKYMGGKETIVYYSHPATKGRSQGGKKFDELTPAEQDIRTFANSRIDQQEKLGFTGDIGWSMNEERTSTISKKRASAELKQKLKGTRSDGMGKYTATIFGMDGDKRVKLKDMNDLNKYSKFELGESVNEAKEEPIVALLKQGSGATVGMGEAKLIKLSDAFEDIGDEQADAIASHLNMAIELMQDGLGKSAAFHMDKFNKACKKEMEMMMKQGLAESIKDKIDAQLMKLLDAVGFDKFADVLIDKFGIDGFTDRLYNAIERMPGGEKILKKLDDMSALKEGMSKEVLYSQIRDIIDSLDSGESDGIPLDNETEMLLQQELRRLRKIMKSLKESTSLEEIYTQVSEAKDFGFFGNEEGSTGNSIVS
ncbi:hypothetical protein HOA97_03705, partial [bacterium]|nr:hypothetical protein [bacterium]